MLDRLRVLPPGRQLLLALAGVCALTIVLLAAWFEFRVPYQPVFTRLKPADAAAIVGELDRKKIAYQLADGGSTILVPASRVDATRLDLANDTPMLKGTVGFELFNKSDMGLTDFAQRINYQRALQGELERTIMTLDGVETARVHLSLGEDRVFRADRVPPKASVTVRMKDQGLLDPAAAAGIQRLVAAAVPQLQVAEVVILDERGAIVSTPTGSAATATDEGMDDSSHAVSAFYAARIRAALKPLVQDSIRVDVRALVPNDDASASGLLFDVQNRTLPLEVHLSPDTPLDASARHEVETAVVQAIAFDPAKGDTISFNTATTPPPGLHRPLRLAGPLTSESGSAPAPALSDRIPWIYGGALALVVAIGAFIALGMRARRSLRPLSPSERTRLAARLAHLIDQEESVHAREA